MFVKVKQAVTPLETREIWINTKDVKYFSAVFEKGEDVETVPCMLHINLGSFGIDVMGTVEELSDIVDSIQRTETGWEVVDSVKDLLLRELPGMIGAEIEHRGGFVTPSDFAKLVKTVHDLSLIVKKVGDIIPAKSENQNHETEAPATI